MNYKEMNYSCFWKQLKSVFTPGKKKFSVSDPEKYLLKYKL